MLNKADFFEKLVRFEQDKIEKSSGLNIKNSRKCLIISLEPKVKWEKSGLSGLTKSGLTGVECICIAAKFIVFLEWKSLVSNNRNLSL